MKSASHAAFHAVIGTLGNFQLCLFEGQFILSFDDPVLRGGTLEALGLVLVFVPLPGLDQEGAGLRLRDFL